MIIKQIIAGTDGDVNGHDHTIYGLDDRGGLWRWQDALTPRCQYYLPGGYVRMTLLPNEPLSEEAVLVTFTDGCSAGWVFVGTSEMLSKPVPHPLDPSRAERS